MHGFQLSMNKNLSNLSEMEEKETEFGFGESS